MVEPADFDERGDEAGGYGELEWTQAGEAGRDQAIDHDGPESGASELEGDGWEMQRRQTPDEAGQNDQTGQPGAGVSALRVGSLVVDRGVEVGRHA